MREGIEGVGKWTNVWARGEYASLTLVGWTPLTDPTIIFVAVQSYKGQLPRLPPLTTPVLTPLPLSLPFALPFLRLPALRSRLFKFS